MRFPRVTFQAREEGTCPNCNMPIKVGANVHLLDDGTTIHAECYR